MKFRKKPVIIDAIRINFLFANEMTDWPSWAQDAFQAEGLDFNDTTVSIRTLEGRMDGHRDDWLIRGVKGELYPCKPDIFAMTYDPVDEETT